MTGSWTDVPDGWYLVREESLLSCVSCLGKEELLVGLQKGRGDVPHTLHSQ